MKLFPPNLPLNKWLSNLDRSSYQPVGARLGMRKRLII
jgi:hypothetical protein